MIFLTASWYSTGWWWKSSAVFTSGYLDTFCSSQDGLVGECLQIGDQIGEARLERPDGGDKAVELESAVRLQQPLRRARLREHEQLPATHAEELAADLRGRIACKEAHQPRNVKRRDFECPLLVGGLGVVRRLDALGDPGRGKRGERVAADARAREVMRDDPREAHQARLCRRVRRLPEVAVETGAGHDVHDRARGAAGLRLFAHG